MVKGKSTVSPEDFVTTFAQAKSSLEVAKKLGLTEAAVYARAAALRRAGVKLKRFPRGRRNSVDAQALNDLLHRLGALDDTSDAPQEPAVAQPRAKKAK